MLIESWLANFKDLDEKKALTLSYTPRVYTDPDHFEAFYLPLV
jgi:hypothetical protein